MISQSRKVGVSSPQFGLIDRWAHIQLDGLEAHFAENRFLFGDRPALGDYGLIGPLFGHLGRDPWPKRELIAPRKHLAAWIERMQQPDAPCGEFRIDDATPATLTPALHSIFDEMLPFLQGCADAVRTTPIHKAKPKRVFGDINHPFAGGTYRRKALSYPVWMAQRMLDAYRAMSVSDQGAVRAWLDEVGGSAVLRLALPRVARVGLAAKRVKLRAPPTHVPAQSTRRMQGG